MTKEEHKEQIRKFILNFAITGPAAAISKTIVAPIDRIKLLMQNQSSAYQVLTGQAPKYKGFLDALIHLPGQQGLFSYWRGNGTNIIRYFPTQALNFSFNDVFKFWLGKLVPTDNPSGHVLVKFVSGGLAGACSCGICYPLEFCQTRISVDFGDTNSEKVKREFIGLRHCIFKVHSIDGIRGLYSGFAVGVVGIFVYRSMYFGLYDSVKRLWHHQKIQETKETPKMPFVVSLFFAQCCTILSGMISYPLDTVGRRLMLESGRPQKLRMFKSSWGTFKSIYKNEGVIAFYRGCLVNCVRGTASALVLVSYDEILHYTDWKRRIEKK